LLCSCTTQAPAKPLAEHCNRHICAMPACTHAALCWLSQHFKHSWQQMHTVDRYTAMRNAGAPPTNPTWLARRQLCLHSPTSTCCGRTCNEVAAVPVPVLLRSHVAGRQWHLQPRHTRVWKAGGACTMAHSCHTAASNVDQDVLLAFGSSRVQSTTQLQPSPMRSQRTTLRHWSAAWCSARGNHTQRQQHTSLIQATPRSPHTNYYVLKTPLAASCHQHPCQTKPLQPLR
jgi:hypothetical protein